MADEPTPLEKIAEKIAAMPRRTRTRVVNIRHEPYQSDPSLYVYVGRAGHGKDGTFGNPHPLGVHSQCMECFIEDFPPVFHDGPGCLAAFRSYFLERVKKDTAFRARVLALRGRALGCFCVRKDGSGECHAKIIAEWVDLETDLDEWARVNEKIRSAPPAKPLEHGARVRLLGEPVRWTGPSVKGRDGKVTVVGFGSLEGFVLVELDRARDERLLAVEMRVVDVELLEPQASLFPTSKITPRAGGDPS